MTEAAPQRDFPQPEVFSAPQAFLRMAIYIRPWADIPFSAPLSPWRIQPPNHALREQVALLDHGEVRASLEDV